MQNSSNKKPLHQVIIVILNLRLNQIKHASVTCIIIQVIVDVFLKFALCRSLLDTQVSMKLFLRCSTFIRCYLCSYFVMLHSDGSYPSRCRLERSFLGTWTDLSPVFIPFSFVVLALGGVFGPLSSPDIC